MVFGARVRSATSRSPRSCSTYTPGTAAVASNVRRVTASCRLCRGYPGVFPNNTAPRPRPAWWSGPTRVYRIPRTRLSAVAGGNGRHRCAQTPAAPPARGPDDRNAAPPLARATGPLTTPPHRPPYAFPRTFVVVVVVILDGRPLVVNTCSVREHASYVITTHTRWSICIYCYLFILILICPSAFR